MEFNISFFNLWLFVVVGYAIIWAYMPVVNKKRGKAIEDPELYNHVNKKQMIWTWYISLFGKIALSLFIPLQQGALFVIGVLLYVLGIALNLIAMSTFSELADGLNKNGIYRFSRNPMYVGGFFFLLGLCVMGFSLTVLFGVFVLLFVFWIITTHNTVKKEEKFLQHKYGKEYEDFKKRIPRYIGFK